ncbi:MAG: hypothetical protein U0794_20035 [Isosphaeraceae bacterium]
MNGLLELLDQSAERFTVPHLGASNEHRQVVPVLSLDSRLATPVANTLIALARGSRG